MRWPLIYQVTLPLAIWTLLTVTALSVLNYGYARAAAQAEVTSRLASVTRQLSEARFPLSLPVLQQIEGLTGTELAVTNQQGELVRATLEISADELPRLWRQKAAQGIDLTHAVTLSGARYFQVSTTSRFAETSPLTVHLLYPAEQYHTRVSQAFWPLMLLGVAAVGPMLLVAVYLAARITRPIVRLQAQVDQIAEGQFAPVPPGRRNDELRDLALAINQMARQLESYEGKVRTMERAQVLGQIGAGFAHQIRNAMTGGRMALGLHRLECNLPQGESLHVAERQMKLVEHLVQSMLRLGSKQQLQRQAICVPQLIEQTVALVAPQAQHHGVTIARQVDPALIKPIFGDFVLLQTCLMNLLLNGLEATLAARSGEAVHEEGTPALAISAAQDTAADLITIRVTDEGRGPAEAIAARLFEPLVTTKPEGTGLGLAVVREIVELHGGEITWYRLGSQTCFEMTLPTTEAD